MSPVSLIYLLILPFAVLLFYVIPHKFRWAVLLTLSVLFYLSWSLAYTGLMAAVALLSYGAALWIDSLHRRNHQKKATWVFAISLVVLVGLIAFFKYFDLFVSGGASLLTMMGVNVNPRLLSIAIPVGLSFYIFETIGYLADVFKGKYKAEKHLGYYAVFVSFFATILAGPIERADHLIPQLKAKRPFSWDNVAEGGKYLIIGYFKKLVIADILAIYVDKVYGGLALASGLSVLVATIFFAFEIFADFSGYSDIAKGTGKLFGLDLIENFDQPYRATSSQDFWHRWHISLSTFFRDYVYFPLGGSRVNKFRWAINVLVVFALSGLWHGANWTFLLWGLAFALYQIIGKLTLSARNLLWKRMGLDPAKGFVKGLRIVTTFVLVALAWMLFRADSIADYAQAMVALFTHYGKGYGFASSFTQMGLTWSMGLLCVATCSSTYFLDGLKKAPTWPLLVKHPRLTETTRICLYIGLMYATVAAFVFLYSRSTPSSFVYFNF